MCVLEKKQVLQLRRIVWSHYKKSGRHDLPWRKTKDPYRILVSEVMLQQTQVARVVPKYRKFIRRFPTVHVLAEAPLRDVLVLWSGLGYNRRAKMLHEAAKAVVSQCGGRMPRSHTALMQLPGVGDYTAGAVCAFAYNQGVAMVETNIRTVLIHHLYPDSEDVTDAELLQLTVVLCPRGRAREWYWALMDYGAYLKERGVKVNNKSKHYVKQSKFAGSDRQIRGVILKLLTAEKQMSEKMLLKKVKAVPERVRAQLTALVGEGLVTRVPGGFTCY